MLWPHARRRPWLGRVTRTLSLHVPTTQIKVVFDKHHDKLSRVAVISGEACRLQKKKLQQGLRECMPLPWAAPSPPPYVNQN